MKAGKRKGAALVKRISEGARGVVKIEVVEDAGVGLGGEEYVAVGRGN